MISSSLPKALYSLDPASTTSQILNTLSPAYLAAYLMSAETSSNETKFDKDAIVPVFLILINYFT